MIIFILFQIIFLEYSKKNHTVAEPTRSVMSIPPSATYTTTATVFPNRTTSSPDSDFYKRQIPRRRDSARRHTLGHGVDDSMIRRSKLLAEEKRIIFEGLQTVDELKNWWVKRLSNGSGLL